LASGDAALARQTSEAWNDTNLVCSTSRQSIEHAGDQVGNLRPNNWITLRACNFGRSLVQQRQERARDKIRWIRGIVGYSPTILALYAIDALGFTLAITAMVLEKKGLG
jgi:hypothetical protein